MQSIDVSKAILQKVELSDFKDRNCTFFVQRDDLIHPEISGNKWRKLKYNLEIANSKQKTGILTFGGAYSNHILATAFACKEFGMKSIGIIRGDELNENSNQTLRRSSEAGMQLIFVSRNEYKQRNESDYLKNLATQFLDYQIVPEGGANYHGMIGCQEIIADFPKETNHIFVAQGTTTTSCGILLGLKSDCQLNVVPVLKNYDSIGEMTHLLQKSGFESDFVQDKIKQVNVLSDYHCGGYGKWNKELVDFVLQFFDRTRIPLDIIYTGKTVFALFDQLKQGKLDNSTVVFVHTGGLRGNF